MQAANMTLVILGDKAAPGLGSKHNGGFGAVERLPSLSAFQTYITGQSGLDPEQLVVVFDASLKDDGQAPTEHLAAGLARKGARVVLIGITTAHPLDNTAELPARSGEKPLLGAVTSLGVEGAGRAKKKPQQTPKAQKPQPPEPEVTTKPQDTPGSTFTTGWGSGGVAPSPTSQPTAAPHAEKPSPVSGDAKTSSSGWGSPNVVETPLHQDPAAVKPVADAAAELVPAASETEPAISGFPEPTILPAEKPLPAVITERPRTAADLLRTHPQLNSRER